jgi:DNA-directed RNA polymerase specialized sigma24 family protein
MSNLQHIRASLVEVSRRYSRVAHEVEDLAHDIVLSALRRGSSLDGETFLRSARGAARRHAAFLARSAGRRRAREAANAGEHVADGADASWRSGNDEAEAAPEAAPLAVLSPALRTTLLLLYQGLEKAELRLALGVTDAALRKRFQALREHGPLARPELPVPSRTPALALLRRSQVRLLRGLVAPLAAAGASPRVLAASDPDGHGVIFAEVLTTGRLTATSGASATNHRARRKDIPC